MLIGRQGEIGRLTALLREDRRVVVVGEPGIGKTVLLHAALAADGRRPYLGGGLATLRWMEYVPLARALGVRRLNGDPAAVAQRVRIAIGERGILALDDLQWAGDATLEVISLLAESVPIAATLRSGDPDADELLARLVTLGFAVLDLSSLADEHATALVRALRADFSEVATRRVVRRCGGVPLLLTQLAGPDGEASKSLRIALASRLRDLDVETVALFHLLALVGRPMRILPGELAALMPLEHAGLVHGRDGTVEVVHAVLAELALAQLTEEGRRELHRRAAKRLRDPGEAARHFEAAGDRERARRLALRAADAAENRATEAASHLALAARCSTGRDADELRLRAAMGLTVALRHADADRLLDEVEGTDPATRARVSMIRSRTSWYRAEDDGFRAALASAVEHGERAGPELYARALVERSRQAIFLDPDLEPGGVAMARDGLEAAERAGIPTARAEMLSGLASYMADRTDWRPAMERALEQARAVGDVDTELTTANNLITAHESSGEPSVGRTLASEMIERCGRLNLVGWQLQFRAMLLNLDLHAADYSAAVSLAVELLDEPIDGRARAQIESALSICLTDLGRTDLARQRLKEIEEGPQRDLVGLDTVRWLQAEAELHGGRPSRAYDLARGAAELGFTDPFAALVERWALIDLGRQPGEPLDAQTMPLLRGVRPESLGLAALAAGDHARAATEFDEAAVAWHPYHRRGEFRSRWGAAEAIRLSGDASDATRRLLELEAELATRQMLPMLARAHRSLRALGMRRSAPRSRQSARELTDRQLEVMQLVASGLTNGEIGRRLGISRSTVTELIGSATHSLGATSRGQAAALVAS